jgi:hypothetical protein
MLESGRIAKKIQEGWKYYHKMAACALAGRLSSKFSAQKKP